ncbi:unnamed protein product [Arabis nemorensis]|uniref:Uncharacterized protein n=1 Tax=Arabis nemorensis TaxID=586526 RepID=A0A565B9Q8_9BRAS|nr:unnamed protein product [Arabis nemorensis]
MDSMKQHESSSLETKVIHDDESMPEMISEEDLSTSVENETKLVEESRVASMVMESKREDMEYQGLRIDMLKFTIKRKPCYYTDHLTISGDSSWH